MYYEKKISAYLAERGNRAGTFSKRRGVIDVTPVSVCARQANTSERKNRSSRTAPIWGHAPLQLTPERESERQAERDRQADGQTETETKTWRQIETESGRESEREKEREKEEERARERETYRIGA